MHIRQNPTRSKVRQTFGGPFFSGKHKEIVDCLLQSSEELRPQQQILHQFQQLVCVFLHELGGQH